MLPLWVVQASASEPCYGWQLPNYVEGEHLSVQWDDFIDLEAAEAYAAVGDEAWEVFAGNGFPSPLGAPSVLFQPDVFGRGGYTDTVACDDVFHPRMYVYIDDSPYSEATLAHELFHAVQYAYQPEVDFIANYYIWPWWAEGTAEWTAILTEQDPRTWSGAVSGYLQNGHLALHHDATAFLDPELATHMYGTAVLAAYLAEREGSGVIDETFTAVQGHPSERAWFPDVIESTGRDFDALWEGYLAILPTVALDIDTSQVEKAIAVSQTAALPADGGEDLDHPPQGLGWAIHAFEEGLGAPGDVLVATVDGDPAAEWHAVLVRTEAKRVGSAVLEVVALEMGADGHGTGQIAIDGEHPVFLVVSPEADDDDGFTYRWSAERVGAAVEPTGCGCASPGPSAWWAAPVLAFGFGRRKRGRRPPAGAQPTRWRGGR